MTFVASSGEKPASDQRLRLDLQRFLALHADAAHQPLRADQVHGRSHQERFDTHIHQPADRGRRIIRVQRGEHQVAGERGLDGDFSRLEVSNFADQNDVGVLPQEGAQSGGKVQPDLLLHLHLVDPGKLEFDRVLGGHDVGFGRVQARYR